MNDKRNLSKIQFNFKTIYLSIEILVYAPQCEHEEINDFQLGEILI